MMQANSNGNAAWDAQAAFERALASGRLSHDRKAPNWVGHYMYMGPNVTGLDTFKHSMTREYLPHAV